MNSFDKIHEIELSENVCLDKFVLEIDEDKCCCVCFSECYYIRDMDKGVDLSLSDIDTCFFANDWIPNDLLIKSCCGVHYICINCIRNLINNYENHPINELNSHFACPYPFEDCLTPIGFKNVFDHNLIRKICNDQEWINYNAHADRFSFPGCTIVKCPVFYYKSGQRILCNTEILLENEIIKNTAIGDFIVECTQNAECLRRFCFNCKQTMSYYQTSCFDCKTTHENENPRLLNYFFNKNVSSMLSNVTTDISTDEIQTIDYNEESYLYYNSEITAEIATQQIIELIDDVNSFIICPICKISLYKTERCNGLSHHNIERCYACSRIGFKTKGLGEHWNTCGIDGCFRFDYDPFVKTNIPHYMCNDSLCSNHDKGDCNIPDHKSGIDDINNVRKCCYVYHVIKSLLPEVRFTVYDNLYTYFSDPNRISNLKYLPYKQTLVLLTKFKRYNRDYTEEIVYKNLNCTHPAMLDFEKNFYLDSDDYISKYSTEMNQETSRTYSYYNQEVNQWRNIIDQELVPVITRRYTVTNLVDDELSDNEDNISIDSTSGLLVNSENGESSRSTVDITEVINIPNENIIQNDNVDHLTSTILEQLINELNNPVTNVTGNGYVTHEYITHEYITPNNQPHLQTPPQILISDRNRYDLPTITLNSYSMLLSTRDSDTESETEI